MSLTEVDIKVVEVVDEAIVEEEGEIFIPPIEIEMEKVVPQVFVERHFLLVISIEYNVIGVIGLDVMHQNVKPSYKANRASKLMLPKLRNH